MVESCISLSCWLYFQEHLVDSETEATEQIKRNCQKVQSTLLATDSIIPFQALQHSGVIPPTASCEATTSISSTKGGFGVDVGEEGPSALDLISSSGNSGSSKPSSGCITTIVVVGGSSSNNNHSGSRGSCTSVKEERKRRRLKPGVCLHTYKECAKQDSSHCAATGNTDLHLSCKECFLKGNIISHSNTSVIQRKCRQCITYGNQYISHTGRLKEVKDTISDGECDVTGNRELLTVSDLDTSVLLDSLVISNHQCLSDTDGEEDNLDSLSLVSAHALQKSVNILPSCQQSSGSEGNVEDKQQGIVTKDIPRPTDTTDIAQSKDIESDVKSELSSKPVCQCGEQRQYLIPTHLQSAGFGQENTRCLSQVTCSPLRTDTSAEFKTESTNNKSSKTKVCLDPETQISSPSASVESNPDFTKTKSSKTSNNNTKLCLDPETLKSKSLTEESQSVQTAISDNSNQRPQGWDSNKVCLDPQTKKLLQKTGYVSVIESMRLRNENAILSSQRVTVSPDHMSGGVENFERNGNFSPRHSVESPTLKEVQVRHINCLPKSPAEVSMFVLSPIPQKQIFEFILFRLCIHIYLIFICLNFRIVYNFKHCNTFE